MANLATVVSAAAANPLAKAAAFGYGVRKAAAARRPPRRRREVRASLKQRRKAAARGPLTSFEPGRNTAMKRLFWLGVGLAVGAWWCAR